MNVLADLLSSNVKAEVFRLLFVLHHQPLHLRELATSFWTHSRDSSAGTASSPTSWINRSPSGRKPSYIVAKEDHPLYAEIRGLVLKTIGLAEVLRRALQKEKRIKVAFCQSPKRANKRTAMSIFS